jgi:hypothetical protein
LLPSPLKSLKFQIGRGSAGLPAPAAAGIFESGSWFEVVVDGPLIDAIRAAAPA